MLNQEGNLSSLRKIKKQSNPMPGDLINIKKLSQLYNDILQPLTLFPTPVRSLDEQKDAAITQAPDKNAHKEVVDESICRDDAYMCALSPFMEDLSKMSANTVRDLVKRRLHKISALNIGLTEVQKAFEEIILGEVITTCDNIPHVLCSTLLTAQEKQKLHRRLISHILIVSEQLFIYYLKKMEWNKTQSVFSEEANLTRLKAQLLLDCSKFFNLISAQHYLIAEIKELEGQDLTQRETEEILPNKSNFPEHTNKKSTYYGSINPHFTMAYFVRLGRPKKSPQKLQKDIDLMQFENIPQLDLKKVQTLIPRRKDESTFPQTMQCDAIRTPCPNIHSEDQKIKEKSSPRKYVTLKKWPSCPNLMISDLVKELCVSIKQYSSECPEILSWAGTVKTEEHTLSQDLKRLVEDSSLQKPSMVGDPYCDEEIPPLIRALPHGIGDKVKLHKMQELLKDLDHSQEQCQKGQETKASPHPQASSVDILLPKKPLLRRADAQPSDRIYTNTTDIAKYPPVYNHFSNEIEAASVTRLDRNLFVGKELKEVYSELTKNISTDHLKFDQDSIIEPYATKLDFSKCVASSTLTRNKNQRVINKELDSVALNDKSDSADQYIPMDKEASRYCNSWLTWWKSLVNFDDYMKYISTKDLDYLKVIYHLYNSDSEDEEQAKLALKKMEEELKRERDKKIADLRAEKQNYMPGMWNINSVMLGGLGSDPSLQGKTHNEILQKKINAIWKALHVPEALRLDMAIKYSSAEYQDCLPQAIEMWEKAVNIIQKREEILAELEQFEREASDPNRFFQRGYNGTSMARMKESRIRKKLHTQLTEIEHEILELLQVIKKSFNDTVTFKGRPYVEKIQRDKIEMLYWLQQDRRKDVMEKNLEKQHALLKL
ncbi:coiled-coil domain-containing protein 87 [Pelobates fuscus]|uniref:coiled-coil domain-containing protein 87 n=1 Tax=Pelobates fuscus TaxID=191477 RepID=UPI002FE42C8B